MTHVSATTFSAAPRRPAEQPPPPIRRLSLTGRVALAGLLTIVLATLLGPLLWPQDPLAQNIVARLAGPSLAHPLGTDQFGRDVLARLLLGGRWSLLGAGIVCLGTTMIGFTLGVLAAAGPRWLDRTISTITTTFQAVPGVLLALALTALLGASFVNLLVALILTNWTWYARMYRAQVAQALAAPYIEGARAVGVGPWRMLARHIGPHILGPALVVATINVGAVILNLSALSFIGLGLPPPTPEWGTMISEARTYFQRAPLLMLAPGLAIASTVLCVNLLGNACAIESMSSARGIKHLVVVVASRRNCEATTTDHSGLPTVKTPKTGASSHQQLRHQQPPNGYYASRGQRRQQRTALAP
ncbi:ABC transporter permease [Candidatus Gracilibacteria bacterium]|nr:ABC transporter permease [Candidatus Gracilibacteria bacterium]